MKKKVLFVSSTGGHLKELLQLNELFKKYNYYIVTENTKSNKYLKDKYKNKVSYLIYGTKKHIITYIFKLIINSFKCAYIYLKFRPDYVISTGAHTGGLMCLISKIFGARIIYIETFANLETKSVTGNLCYRFADLFIVQWESMLDKYPKAKYGGWIIK